MKEIVQFKESDKEMIEAFHNLRKEAKHVFDMWDARFNEVATTWREHRNQLIEELGGRFSEEFNLTDRFCSNLRTMRDVLQSPCKVLFDNDSDYEYLLEYIKPINELKHQEAERIKILKTLKS